MINKEKKKIVFNGYSLINNEFFGVHRQAFEILKEIDNISDDKYEIIVLSPKKINYDFSTIKNVVVPFKINIFKATVWKYYVFNNFAKKNKAITIDLLLNCIPHCDILAVYDCIVEKFSKNYKTFYEKFLRYICLIQTRYAIKTSKNIVTISDYSKNDISYTYNYKKDNIYLVQCAYQHIYSIKSDNDVLQKFGLKQKKYFFSLGSRYYHKNYKWVIEAAKSNNNYIFVISGSNNQNTSDNYLENCNVDNVIFTGYLTDNEIKTLMINCKAFILPSFYEGFGITPLEALAVGSEIILSNTSCLPEIYGNSAHYINPYEYDNIDIDKILLTEVCTPNIVLSKYSWKKSAMDLLKIVEGIIKNDKD